MDKTRLIHFTESRSEYCHPHTQQQNHQLFFNTLIPNIFNILKVEIDRCKVRI